MKKDLNCNIWQEKDASGSGMTFVLLFIMLCVKKDTYGSFTFNFFVRILRTYGVTTNTVICNTGNKFDGMVYF